MDRQNTQCVAVRVNAVRISNRTYLIYTQAGFRKVLKRLYPENWKSVEGYPQSYPSVVVYAEGYRGYHYPQCYCTPARLMLEVLRNS